MHSPAQLKAQAPQDTQSYHFPPGLKHNLAWYAFRQFRPADPIHLFEYLAREFGTIAHYKLGPSHIVFVNDPALIREVLVVQHDNFVKERTQRRTKMLLGEGMITAEGAKHRTERRAALRNQLSTASGWRLTPMPSLKKLKPPPLSGSRARSLTFHST